MLGELLFSDSPKFSLRVSQFQIKAFNANIPLTSFSLCINGKFGLVRGSIQLGSFT